MKKSKFIVALLLICVMCVGGSVAVFADSSLMNISDSNGNVYDVPRVTSQQYVYIKNGNIVMFLVSPTITGSGSSMRLSFNKGWYKGLSPIYDWTEYTYDSTGYTSIGTFDASWLALRVVISTCDLVDGEGNVVFPQTVVPVVAAAKNLPTQVLPMIKKIVIVAIGGLALLIGFLILPKKLWLFLKG